ncbi:50S ribosomal protein L3 [Candidatus Woesearchaeota archaeon]|nr:50S ribosomal protein L3 [Candidatus Woesearchaeota archaeon]
MPTTRTPRRGSLQFWPRKRSKTAFARVRFWALSKDAKPLGFAGYKVGMTHLIINDNSKNSTTKGMDIFCPVTIIECPPLKTASIRFYKNTINGLKLVSETLADNPDKELGRKIILAKKKDPKESKEFDFVRLLVYTQPKLTGIGKKKPEIFEIGIGGNKEEQMKYAQEKLGKELIIEEVFREGQQLDMHVITKAKGVQGPVRRFGVNLKNHKSEKGVRRVGTLGGWIAQGHVMWRVAKAGKMGYHTRTEYNKWLLKIGKAGDISRRGGFESYGVVKNQYILVKGSVAGPEKRLIRFNEPIRPSGKIPPAAPVIQSTNLDVNA